MSNVLGLKCRECGRRFDLFDENDADEWFSGHDCEPVNELTVPA